MPHPDRHLGIIDSLLMTWTNKEVALTDRTRSTLRNRNMLWNARGCMQQEVDPNPRRR